MMSFDRKYISFPHQINFIKKGVSFGVSPEDQKKKSKAYTVFGHIKHVCSYERISSFFSVRVKGAMSVEASLAVPLFIFFMANLLMLFVMFAEYSSNIAKTGQTAKEIALVSNDVNSVKDDIVTIFKIQKIAPLIDKIGFKTANTYACMKYRKWNGYDVTGAKVFDEDEEYVYITESGTSYHRSRGCSHLKVKIRCVTKQMLESTRNNNGEKYKPCEKCARNSSGLLFITEEGNKYHSSSACSGLKRTVKTVKLSEVGGRTPCKDCSK